jgi:hypothetical protein
MCKLWLTSDHHVDRGFVPIALRQRFIPFAVIVWRNGGPIRRLHR